MNTENFAFSPVNGPEWSCMHICSQIVHNLPQTKNELFKMYIRQDQSRDKLRVSDKKSEMAQEELTSLDARLKVP